LKLWTIGHSTRSLREFLSLLERARVTHIADVRRFPGSRRHPQFERDALAAALARHGIGYAHHPELGGRRTPLPNSPHRAWRNAGFRGYADYMDTPEFQIALTELVSNATLVPTAIVCAEAVPWRCHRSLIADALVARGAEVEHILDGGTSAHALPRFAVVRDGRVSYSADPPELRGQGDLFGL
jgi:uncharacterized protein (DUF488 family)